MARARFIRPEFFIDDKAASLTMEARLLFISIWCQCDLRGVFEWNLKQLRAQTFPHDERITVSSIDLLLWELITQEMVIRFEVENKIWGYVRKFTKHQAFTTSEKKYGTDRPAPPSKAKTINSQTQVRPESASNQKQAIPLTLTPSLAPAHTPEPALTPTLENKSAPCSGPLAGAMQGRGMPIPKVVEDGLAELARKTALAKAMQAEREIENQVNPEAITA